MHWKASYRRLLASGELCERAAKADELLSPCRLCPRRCEARRREGERGFCGIAHSAVVASLGPHFGEEPELVGHRGSGTVFFSGCNLGCLFCQNYDISHQRQGSQVNPEALAEMFLSVQGMGCHNLNLVTPTHVMPQILSALVPAVERGFSLPIVYNTGGYDPPEALALLDGVVDLYMPDVKSFAVDFCEAYFQAPDYPAVVREAVVEMARQVGDFQTDERGVARRGLLVRHLVMPDREEDSRQVLEFLSRELPARPRVNVMDQYRPCFRSHQFPELDHRTPRELFERVRDYALELGLELVR